MTDGTLPDTATFAFTLVRILEGRIAVDDVPEYTGLDTGFTPDCHPVEGSRGLFQRGSFGVRGLSPANEPWFGGMGLISVSN